MPFDFAEGTPGDTAVVSQFPAAERTFRAAVEAALAIEHDMPGSMHHKFTTGSTVARDVITDWCVGALFINTDTTPAVLQRVVSIGPVVWESFGTAPDNANDILAIQVFS